MRPRTLGRIAHAVVATGGMGHDVLIAGANGQIVRALFEAFNRRDLDGILSCLDRDVSCEMGAGVEQWAFPEAAEPTRGHAAIAAFYRRTWPVMEEARADPLELVEDGDRVTVTLAMSARLARTGLVSRWRDPHVGTLRDGKIVHYEIHTERGQAQQTLNLTRPSSPYVPRWLDGDPSQTATDRCATARPSRAKAAGCTGGRLRAQA